MQPKLFDELLGSVREGGAIPRGEKRPSRRFVVAAAGVRGIREKTELSQRLLGNQCSNRTFLM